MPLVVSTVELTRCVLDILDKSPEFRLFKRIILCGKRDGIFTSTVNHLNLKFHFFKFPFYFPFKSLYIKKG